MSRGGFGAREACVVLACVAMLTGPAPRVAMARDAAREVDADSTANAREPDREAPAQLIAGLLPCTPDLEARWPWSGTWVFPVGDSLTFGRGLDEAPGYKVNRGLLTRNADGTNHDGADLANGLAGGRVRAAASGMVVTVESSSSGGYGTYIVLAHHLDEGRLAYTVYSHLLAGSTRVSTGSAVSAGDWIARVGQTGRASTPHLHFEVRLPRDSTLRWEHCDVVDPVDFITERLPEARPDSDWAAPYLAWAEFAALIPRGLNPGMALDQALLERVLDRIGIRDPEFDPTRSSSRGEGGSRGATAEWNSVARALANLNARPRRLPPCSIEPRRTARLSREVLGVKRPARELHRLAGLESSPTLGELCLALADFADRPATRAPATRNAPSARKHPKPR